MDQSTRQDAKRMRWLKLIQKFTRSIARTVAQARPARRGGSRRKANLYNTLTVTISCCRQNSSFRLLGCDNAVIALSHMENRASTLTVIPQLMWHGSGLV